MAQGSYIGVVPPVRGRAIERLWPGPPTDWMPEPLQNTGRLHCSAIRQAPTVQAHAPSHGAEAVPVLPGTHKEAFCVVPHAAASFEAPWSGQAARPA